MAIIGQGISVAGFSTGSLFLTMPNGGNMSGNDFHRMTWREAGERLSKEGVEALWVECELYKAGYYEKPQFLQIVRKIFEEHG